MENDIRITGVDTNLISDGYHTFGELYEHRIELFIALCRLMREIPGKVWRSRYHSDGTRFDGWFVLGINKQRGQQITYHIPDSRWVDTEFAEVMMRAPEFDGHTPQDVLVRLERL